MPSDEAIRQAILVMLKGHYPNTLTAEEVSVGITFYEEKLFYDALWELIISGRVKPVLVDGEPGIEKVKGISNA